MRIHLNAMEHITHSLCTLEFQDHRALYDWFIQHLPVPAQPKQIEFSRLNLSHTVTVNVNYVRWWNNTS